MIPIYNIEDLTIDIIDDLVERGVVFDVTSKATLLPKSTGNDANDAFWRNRSRELKSVQSAIGRQGDSTCGLP